METQQKICKECGTTETTRWFSGPTCRKCYRRAYDLRRDPERETKRKQYRKDRWQKHKNDPEYKAHKRVCIEERKKRGGPEYVELLKKKEREKRRTQRAANPDRDRIYSNERSKIRRKEDQNFRIRTTLRSRLSHALKGREKPGSAIKDLGCTIEELRDHLETKFKHEMSWDNYGHKGWHIDHILPLSSFDLTDPEQFKKACHYTNLQPLWWYENLSKGDDLPEPLPEV